MVKNTIWLINFLIEIISN